MRIRTVKPEFWKNEHIAKLDDFTQLLALGLLNYADDEGYFNANPALIRADIFPLREVSGTIPVSITHLSNQGYLKLYDGADGRTYGHIVNFHKHQVINKPKESKIKPLCVNEHGSLALTGQVPDASGVEQGTGNREEEQGKDTPSGCRGEKVKPAFQLRAEALFRRRPTTPYDKREVIAWPKARAVVEATSEEDWKVLEWWFALPAAKAPYRRQNYETLLNNWNAEIERAKKNKGKASQFDI